MTSNFPSSQNAQGVNIVSLALNNAGSFSDPGANSQQVRGWGFNVLGVDSRPDRVTDLRNGFSHFSGFPASLTTFQLGTSRDRRRLVVLQGVSGGRDSNGNELPQWRVLYNRALSGLGATGSSTEAEDIMNEQALLAAINSVFPAPSGLDFSTWATQNSLPNGQNGPFNDADGDGQLNIVEFFLATDPSDPQSQDGQSVIPLSGGGYEIVFRRAKNVISSFTMVLRTSVDLTNWSDVTLTESNTQVTDMGDYEEVRVTVPASGAERFYRMEFSESS